MLLRSRQREIHEKRTYDAKVTLLTGFQQQSMDLSLTRKSNSGKPKQQWYQCEAYEITKLTQLERIDSEFKRQFYS